MNNWTRQRSLLTRIFKMNDPGVSWVLSSKGGTIFCLRRRGYDCLQICCLDSPALSSVDFSAGLPAKVGIHYIDGGHQRGVLYIINSSLVRDCLINCS